MAERDPKDTAAALLIGPATDEGGDALDDASGFEAAADEVYEAAKADDRVGFASALKSAIEICVAELDNPGNDDEY